MSGFSHDRARPHNAAVAELAALLKQAGSSVQLLGVDGHRPDMLVGGEQYYDVKVPHFKLRLSIAAAEIDDQEKQYGSNVFIAWKSGGLWQRRTIAELRQRQIGGARAAKSDEGWSNTKWYLFDEIGVGHFLSHYERPRWFRAPGCDCPETCRECFKEGRTVGMLTLEEKQRRVDHADARLGHVEAGLRWFYERL